MSSEGGSRFPKGLLPVSLGPGASLLRIHWQTNDPIFFGPKPGSPPANRFDAPDGEFRMLYAAQDLAGCFVETVLRRPGRILKRTETDQRAVTQLELQRPVVLAKIMDEGLQWHGLHAGEISVDDYKVSRQLALDLYAAFPQLDGIAFRSRYDNSQTCYALFDRVAPADLAPVGRLDFDKDADLIDRLMERYGAVFDTTPAP